jgi:hypothetical protein
LCGDTIGHRVSLKEKYHFTVKINRAGKRKKGTPYNTQIEIRLMLMSIFTQLTAGPTSHATKPLTAAPPKIPFS